jgi:nitroreductase
LRFVSSKEGGVPAAFFFAQNVYLQAVPLNLGTVSIGAFSDSDVKYVVHMADDEEPLYIMPVGRNV